MLVIILCEQPRTSVLPNKFLYLHLIYDRQTYDIEYSWIIKIDFTSKALIIVIMLTRHFLLLSMSTINL